MQQSSGIDVYTSPGHHKSVAHLGVVNVFCESLASVDEVSRVDANLLENLGNIHSNLGLEVDVCYQRHIAALKREGVVATEQALQFLGASKAKKMESQSRSRFTFMYRIRTSSFSPTR